MTDSESTGFELGEDPNTSPDAEELVEQENYFVVRLGECLYGLEAIYVDQVAPVTRPVRIPMTPDHFLGVVHLRGRMIMVVDLPKILGLPRAHLAREEELDQRLLVLECDGRPFAVIAHAIVGIPSIRADAIRPPDQVAQSHLLGGVKLVEGQFDHAEGVVSILRTVGLLEGLTGKGAVARPDEV